MKSSIYIIENRIVSFDTIMINKPYKHSFVLSNISNDTLYIDKISYSCECVNIIKNIDYIAPNRKDSLIVSITSNQEGYISRAVYIYIKEMQEPIDLILEGYVNQGLSENSYFMNK
jgi:hypothetical protein